MSQTVDYVILGAGIVGLTLALELKVRQPKSKIILVEKESELGRHSSGRNSGVLHSGIFYAEDSIKAKVCSQGAKELAAYCMRKQLPIRKSGKVVVPLDSGDQQRLQILHERGRRNGIAAELIDAKQVKSIEPELSSLDRKFLYLPDVWVIDPISILQTLAGDLKILGIDIFYKVRVSPDNLRDMTIQVNGERVSFGHLFNATGLQADRVAKLCGITEYTVLPFKGLYYQVAKESRLDIRGLIYAVPDPRVPFLGIHYSRNVQGEIYVGPTVVPALGRENYHGFSGMNLPEALEISLELLHLYLKNNQGFRTFVHREAFRFFKWSFCKAAKKLVPRLKMKYLASTGKVGIRAQLVNLKTSELVMDFLVLQGKNSTHILNAVSPAFTSSFAFARLVLDQIGIL